MTPVRSFGLLALTLALVAYASGARHLWELPRTWDILVVGFVALPASLALVWLALPLAERPPRRPLALPLLAAGLAVGFALLDLDGPFQVAKLVAFALIGLLLVSLFESLWWVTLVAVLVPWVDIWSVSAGPTKHVIEERPGILERVAVGYPFPGEDSVVYLGPPDVVFFALFLGTAARFGLRVAWTWAAMTVLLALTFVAVVLGTVGGLPALPAVCLGLLLPNVDLLWSDVREAWRARGGELPDPE